MLTLQEDMPCPYAHRAKDYDRNRAAKKQNALDLIALLRQREDLSEWVDTSTLPNSQKRFWGAIAKNNPRTFQYDFRFLTEQKSSRQRAFVRIHPDLARYY